MLLDLGLGLEEMVGGSTVSQVEMPRFGGVGFAFFRVCCVERSVGIGRLLGRGVRQGIRIVLGGFGSRNRWFRFVVVVRAAS